MKINSNGIEVLLSEVHQNAIDKGFWAVTNDLDLKASDCDSSEIEHCDKVITADKANKISLIASECFELYGSIRSGVEQEQCDKPIPLTSEQEECADILIRLIDYCSYYDINLFECAVVKHIYNKSRKAMHGKNF